MLLLHYVLKQFFAIVLTDARLGGILNGAFCEHILIFNVLN